MKNPNHSLRALGFVLASIFISSTLLSANTDPGIRAYRVRTTKLTKEAQLQRSGNSAGSSGARGRRGRPSRKRTVSLIANVAHRPSVLHSEPVFPQRVIAKLHGKLGANWDRISATRKLRVRSQQDALALMAWAKVHAPGVSLQINRAGRPTGSTAAAAEFESLQWGLHNDGSAQTTALNLVAKLTVPAIAGKDIAFTPTEKSGPKVRIAILDSGVDATHPDLAAHIAHNDLECAALEKYRACVDQSSEAACSALMIDADGNGYPLDCQGWNLIVDQSAGAGAEPTPGADSLNVMGDSDITDDIGHGTHVAGIIAASGKGAVGMIQNAEIIPIKVVGEDPNSPVRPQAVDATTYDGDEPIPAVQPPLPSANESKLNAANNPVTFVDIVARGILYAINAHAQVIHMSLAWPPKTAMEGAQTDGTPSIPLIQSMIEIAQEQGILVVASAGNDATDAQTQPCQFAGVVCVAAHGPDGSIAHFSNYGSWVDVAAPGLNILSTIPQDLDAVYWDGRTNYDYKDGTSMAAPFITGLLARLLNQMPIGLTPADARQHAAEAKAKLFLSATPPTLANDADFKSPLIGPQFIVWGNANLARALAEPALQPVIVPTQKAPILLNWDAPWSATPTILPLQFDLTNLWRDAAAVDIRVSVINGTMAAQHARLSQSSLHFGAWIRGEVKTIGNLGLIVSNPSQEGRLMLKLEITPTNLPVISQAARKMVAYVPVEISVPVGSHFANPRARNIPLTGGPVADGSTLRAFRAYRTGAAQDYLGFQTAADGKWNLQLITETGAALGYQVSAQTRIEAPEDPGSDGIPARPMVLLDLARVDVNLDGQDDYVLIFAPTDLNSRQYQFRFFDAKLQPLAGFDLAFRDTNKVMFSDRYQWLKAEIGGKPRLVPAWFAFGETPAADRTQHEHAWNTPNFQDRQLFFLTPDALRTIKMPFSLRVLQTLAPTEAQKQTGELPILLGEGLDYNSQYRYGVVRDGQVIAESTTVDFGVAGKPRFENMQNPLDVQSLSSATSYRGTVFAGDGVPGSIALGWLMEQPELVPLSQSQVNNLVPVDSVQQATGVFVGDHSRAVFAQSHYQLQYQDLVTGEVAATSLRRYSYLPTLVFDHFFFPVSLGLHSPQGGTDRLPGVLIPAELGDAFSQEVVVPQYSASGRLQALSRPAAFRLTALSGECLDLGDPIAAQGNEPTQSVFFCGDHFVRIPMTW